MAGSSCDHFAVFRQVWMYAKLYNTLPTYHSDEILEAAISGKLRAVADIADRARAPPCIAPPPPPLQVVNF